MIKLGSDHWTRKQYASVCSFCCVGKSWDTNISYIWKNCTGFLCSLCFSVIRNLPYFTEQRSTPSQLMFMLTLSRSVEVYSQKLPRKRSCLSLKHLFCWNKRCWEKFKNSYPNENVSVIKKTGLLRAAVSPRCQKRLTRHRTLHLNYITLIWSPKTFICYV